MGVLSGQVRIVSEEEREQEDIKKVSLLCEIADNDGNILRNKKIENRPVYRQ